MTNTQRALSNQPGLCSGCGTRTSGKSEMSSASETGARAEKQLDRVLGFFPRVEAKASFLFALDVGLLGYGAVHLGREDLHSVYVAAFGAAFIVLTVASLFH